MTLKSAHVQKQVPSSQDMGQSPTISQNWGFGHEALKRIKFVVLRFIYSSDYCICTLLPPLDHFHTFACPPAD